MGKWMNKQETKAVKRIKSSMRNSKLPEMSDRQLGIVVGAFRKDGEAVSRLTVLRARKTNFRRPRREIPGPKPRFEWCWKHMLRTARRMIRDENNPWAVTSHGLLEEIRAWRPGEVRRRRQNGERLRKGDLPLPSVSTILRKCHEKKLWFFDPVNFHELTAAERAKRLKFSNKVLRKTFHEKVDLYADEKSFQLRSTAKHRLLCARSKHKRVMAEAKTNKKNNRCRKNYGRQVKNRKHIIRLNLKLNKQSVPSVQVLAGVEPKRNRNGVPVSLFTKMRHNKINSKNCANAFIAWAKKYRKARRWNSRAWVRIVVDNARFHQNLMLDRLAGHKIMIFYISPYSPDLSPPDYVRKNNLTSSKLIHSPTHGTPRVPHHQHFAPKYLRFHFFHFRFC